MVERQAGDRPRQPRSLLSLPMYVMLALGREGYRASLKAGRWTRMPHFAVMSTLAEAGPSSQKAIVDTLGFDKSDMTKIINDLEAQHLVRRTPDEADSRRHSVALTHQGALQLQTTARELDLASRAFLHGLSPDEYDELTRLLLKAIQAHDDRFAPG